MNDKPEKRMTYAEGIEELNDLIGTPVPIVEADSLRKQFATHGNQGEELPPAMQAAVDDLKARAKDSGKAKTADKK